MTPFDFRLAVSRTVLVSVLSCSLSLSTTPCAAEDTAYRRMMAKAVRNAANRVLPSVVTIEIIGTGGVVGGDVEQDAPTSGVVIDESGFILASSIVVRRPAASILVVLPDATRHAAKVVARDHHRDLVLLKIDTKKKLAAIDFGAKFDLRIGQTTVAVGRYGSDASPMVSRGVLSAVDRLDGIALQTDARVSAALYGGPLIDLYGNVLGILIPAVAQGGAEDATSWYDSGIAFAIPADVIHRKIDRLKSGSDVKKGLIGIVAKSKDPYEDGTAIAAVRTRSPAQQAGIKAGDEVVAVDGKPVRRHQEIRQVLGRFDAGEVIRLKLRRDGKEMELEIKLAESIPPLQPQRLGVIVDEQVAETEPREDSDAASGEESSAPTEVIVDAILPGSAVDEKLQRGDVITRIGDAEIPDVDSLRRQMISAEPEKEIKISFRRDDKPRQAIVAPDSISGELFGRIPESWKEQPEEDWNAQELKLPDAANVAAYVAPEPGGTSRGLGLLVLLLGPGQNSPEEMLKNWSESARRAGVVVCAIAAEDTRRWQPKEIEIVASFAAAVLKKAPIDPSAVAIAASGALAGGKSDAADSMALAVAISKSSTFFGVAVSSKTRPPAVRLRENEPSASLQILLPVDSPDDMPTWAAAVERAGYPIVRGGQVDRKALLRWVRLLQAI